MSKRAPTRFVVDRKGAVAVSVALAMIPILGTVAVSTDYSLAVQKKYQIQQVIDSVATALATDTDLASLPSSALNARAMKYAAAVSGKVDASKLIMSVTSDGEQVSIDATSDVKLNFGGMLGFPNLQIASRVTVQRAKLKNIELALALDNTGSMSGTKINELKKAVKALVDYMKANTKAGDVKIAMVPFVNVVRVDPVWMPAAYLESPPPKKWDGCLTDRDAPSDVTDVAPTGGAQTKFWWRTSTKYSSQVDCGALAPIIPMTTDLAKIRTAADSMIASGSTNVPIGVAWAWHALSSGLPLDQGSPADKKDVMRAMVVLTDGENTDNRWDESTSKINTRMNTVCTNVKASGIVIFMVRVLDGDAALLQSCATSQQHYFNVTNASQMTAVFEKIAGTLSQMRISR